jgi:hypothetical protein
MNLNYLFLRQQVERSLASTAQSDAARQAHEELARQYELEIERQTNGRVAFPWRREENR